MATLAENAAAVKAAQVAIDAAIVAKGGTTEGGLNNAAAAIAAIPSGSGEIELGNALPLGCPRVDRIAISESQDECFIVIYSDDESSSIEPYMDSTVSMENNEMREVVVSEDGSVEETDNVVIGRAIPITFTGTGFHVLRLRFVNQGRVAMQFEIDRLPNNCYVVGTVGCAFDSTSSKFQIFKSYLSNSRYFLSSRFASFIISESGVEIPRACFRDSTALDYVRVRGKFASNGLDYLFGGNTRATRVDFSQMDFSEAISSEGFQWPPDNVFTRFPSDTNKGPRVSLYFGGSPKMTHNSILSIINSLYDHVAAGTGTTPTLTLGSTNLAKLTDAEKQVATDKGWILA